MKNQSSPACEKAVRVVAVLKTLSVKAVRHVLHAIAMFLAMNDKVGYAMRDGDDK